MNVYPDAGLSLSQDGVCVPWVIQPYIERHLKKYIIMFYSLSYGYFYVYYDVDL